MKVAILGYDVEGKASYSYFAARGDQLTICDQNPELAVPAGVTTQLGENYLTGLDQFDLLVRTPGLTPAKILAGNPGVTANITSATNEFLKVCPTRHVIGVTGTKGKGTTTTLLAKMLEASGKHVFLGGNIGVPVLSFLSKLTPESWVVLELSSFQLIDWQYSPPLAVCLMVVPEHLNWHADLTEYVLAKSQLFAHQDSEDVAIYFADNDLSREIAEAGAGQKLPFYRSPGAFVNGNMITIDGQEICTTDELKLLGRHNWQNVCAAITAVWQTGVHDIAMLRSVLTSFSGLEHRLERIRELDGVTYYDDSFGTTPETAIVALQAFAGPKVVILGGSDKGATYDELGLEVVKNTVRKVVLIGSEAGKIQATLDAAGFHDYLPGGNNMTEIVATARAQAEPGDVVLLSTACASFDMFHDYKDRGEQFKAAVLQLT